MIFSLNTLYTTKVVIFKEWDIDEPRVRQLINERAEAREAHEILVEKLKTLL